MDMISLKAWEGEISKTSGVDREVKLTLMVGGWQAFDSVLPVVSLGQVVHAFQANVRVYGSPLWNRSRSRGGPRGEGGRTEGAQTIKEQNKGQVAHAERSL
jgi:hypothetical protein